MFGVLGLCTGFTLCYVLVVLPQRTAVAETTPLPVVKLALNSSGKTDWQPTLTLPTLPPRRAGGGLSVQVLPMTPPATPGDSAGKAADWRPDQYQPSIPPKNLGKYPSVDVQPLMPPATRRSN